MSIERGSGAGFGVSRRIREEIKKAQQEFEAEEKQQRQEADRPLTEAVTAFETTQNDYLKALRDVVLTKALDGIDESALQGIPRIQNGQERDALMVKEAADEFLKGTPQYRPSAEAFDALVGFIERNILDPESPLSWAAAFRILTYAGAMPEPQTDPEPEPETPALNPPVELDPAEEAWKRLERYENEIVCTFEGKGYSLKALDNLPSDLYAKVTRLARVNQYFPQPRH